MGYEVEAVRFPLDEKFPEWGESPYFSVTVVKTATLAEVLTHLYVLIPVFDGRKHYWVPRRRTDAVVGQGAGTAQDPVRRSRGRRPGFHATGGRFSGAGGRAPGWRGEEQDRSGHGRLPTPDGACRPIRRRLSTVLLAGGLLDRPEAGPVSPAGLRRPGPHGQEPRLAHGHAGEGMPGRPGSAAGDRLQGGGRDRPGQGGGRGRLVERANGQGR